MREACTFAVAVAVDRARSAKEARRDFVRHLSLGEINAFFRICQSELNLEKPASIEEDLEEFGS